jgi:hypothetical protein
VALATICSLLGVPGFKSFADSLVQVYGFVMGCSADFWWLQVLDLDLPAPLTSAASGCLTRNDRYAT